MVINGNEWQAVVARCIDSGRKDELSPSVKVTRSCNNYSIHERFPLFRYKSAIYISLYGRPQQQTKEQHFMIHPSFI